MSKQDRQGVRTPADLERKYNFAETREAAKNMTPEGVFNLLTNNGKQQGIYKDAQGDIYINASYIKTGALIASLITTGVLQSKDGSTFYLDLDNGILKGSFSEFSISGKTVKEIADESAGSAVNGQTQEEIYNKLTNNGEAGGIYFLDGQLYINANYLTAGVIESSDGFTFSLDLSNNVLKGRFSELYIAGKKASWQENEDGTYTLVGT